MENFPKSKYTEEHPDSFLNDVAGVVHVGANTGQERALYNNYGLRVIWIEPVPETFHHLRENIRSFEKQFAVLALVTDVDGKSYKFNIANNNGASSSIFDFKQHVDVWPDVKFTTNIMLESITLTSLIEREKINLNEYQALVLDTQGSELLVLQGSRFILEYFEYIKTEVPDFDSYEGCCQLKDIESFMSKNGYEEIARHRFASRPQGGSYFDIVYRRTA